MFLLALLVLQVLCSDDPYSDRWKSKRRDRFVSRSEDKFQAQMERLHRQPWSIDESQDGFPTRYPTRFEDDCRKRIIKPIDLGKAIEERSDVQKKYRKRCKKGFFITDKNTGIVEIYENTPEIPQRHLTFPVVESLD